MGALGNAYRSLENEANDYAFSSSSQVSNSSYSKLMKKLGAGPLSFDIISKLALLMGGHKIDSISPMLTSALATPLMLSSIRDSVKTDRLMKDTAAAHANNFQNYGTAEQIKQLGRMTFMGMSGASTAAAGALAASGHLDLGIEAARHLNPYLLLSKLGMGASHAAGAGASALGFNHLGSILGSDITGIGAGIYGVMQLSKYLNAPMKSNTKKIQLPQIPAVSGISMLLQKSSYSRFGQQISLYQNMNLLKPSEALTLGILNEINLNTSALLPMYEKFVDPMKDYNNTVGINEIIDRYNHEELPNTLTKNQLANRKALMHGLNYTKLSMGNSMYNIFGNGLMKILTGKSHEEFKDEASYILNMGKDSLSKEKKNFANIYKIPRNLELAINTDVSKLMTGNDPQMMLLNVVSNMHEVLRLGVFQLLDMSGKNEHGKSAATFLEGIQDNFNPFGDSGPKFNQRSILGKLANFTDQKILSNLPFWGVLRKLLPDTYPGAEHKSIKSKLFDGLSPEKLWKRMFGVHDEFDVREEFNKNINKKLNFNAKKSAEEYLGKYFPDHMTEIVHQLNQQTQFLSDMLECQNCKKNVIERDQRSWRGGFGEFMSNNDFIEKLLNFSTKETVKNLGLHQRRVKNWFLNPLSKLSGSDKVKEWINSDINAFHDARDEFILNNYQEEYPLFNQYHPGEKISDEKSRRYKKKNHYKIIDSINKNKNIKNIEQSQELQKQEELTQKKNKAFFEIHDYTREIMEMIKCQNEANGIQCSDSGRALNKKDQNNILIDGDSGSDLGLLAMLGIGIKKLGSKLWKYIKMPFVKLKDYLSKTKLFNPLIKGINSFKEAGVKAFKYLGSTLMKLTGIKFLMDKFGKKGTKTTVDDITKKTKTPHNVKNDVDIKKESKFSKTATKTHGLTTSKTEMKIAKDSAKLATKAEIGAVKKGFWKIFLGKLKSRIIKKFGASIAKRIIARLIASGAAIVASGPFAIVTALASIALNFWLLWDIGNLAYDVYLEVKAMFDATDKHQEKLPVSTSEIDGNDRQVAKTLNDLNINENEFKKELQLRKFGRPGYFNKDENIKRKHAYISMMKELKKNPELIKYLQQHKDVASTALDEYMHNKDSFIKKLNEMSKHDKHSKFSSNSSDKTQKEMTLISQAQLSASSQMIQSLNALLQQASITNKLLQKNIAAVERIQQKSFSIMDS